MSFFQRIAVITLGLAAGGLFAQERPSSGKDWEIAVGAAGIYGSEYPGSDEHELMGVPFIDIKFKDRFFLNVPDGLGVNLVDREAEGGLGYRFGVAIAPEFQDRDRGDVPNLPEVDMTALGTVFGSIRYESFTLGATFAHDLLGSGHEGSWVEVDLDWSTRVGRRGFVRIGPFARYADDDYMRSFYSVTPAVASTTPLQPFQAGSGTESFGARALGVWRLSRQWELFGQLSVENLAGDAKDSPITVEDNPVSAIFAVAYRFE